MRALSSDDFIRTPSPRPETQPARDERPQEMFVAHARTSERTLPPRETRGPLRSEEGSHGRPDAKIPRFALQDPGLQARGAGECGSALPMWVDN